MIKPLSLSGWRIKWLPELPLRGGDGSGQRRTHGLPRSGGRRARPGRAAARDLPRLRAQFQTLIRERVHEPWVTQ